MLPNNVSVALQRLECSTGCFLPSNRRVAVEGETVLVCTLRTAGLDALTELLIFVSHLCQNKMAVLVTRYLACFCLQGSLTL